MRTLYEILGVDPDASAEELRSAYHGRVLATHPDTAHDAGSDDVGLVIEAWRILGDPEQRADYDRRLGEAPAVAHLPEDPPTGFALFPRRSPHDWRYRAADVRRGGLSLSAETADLRGLAELGDLDLWKLDLSGCPVDDAGLTVIRRFRRLQALDLSSTAITDAGLLLLADLPLEQLQLTGCAITDASLRAIGAMTSLETLRLDATAITSAGVAALAGLSRLAVLDLRETDVDDHVLDALLELPRLRELRVPRHVRHAAHSLHRVRPSVMVL